MPIDGKAVATKTPVPVGLGFLPVAASRSDQNPDTSVPRPHTFHKKFYWRTVTLIFSS